MKKNKLNKLQSQIGYRFKEPKLLKKALTHRSYLNESQNIDQSNERLEFLGDAVLELIISHHLFNSHPNQPEGILTSARSAIVRTESLAKLAQKLDLGSYLLLSKGEEKSGGRNNTHLLANTTEALIGAIYLDQGLKACQAFTDKHLIPLAKAILTQPLKDPKSRLQEQTQALGYSSPTYKTISQIGPDHNKTFTINVLVNHQKLASGKGKSKQEAQQKAAKKALLKVPSLAPKA